MSGYVGDTKLEGLDIGVLVTYFVVVIGFGIWSSLKNRGSVGGYFLAGRSMHFVLVGASLFASNIGSGHFIGLAGSGAATGIGISVFELNAIFILVLLGWYFVPVYIASGVFTMPEYLRLRFGGQRIRVYLAVMALLLSIFTKVAADLFAGAIFIEQALGWNLYAAICLLLAIAALFTIGGGLTAVIWTDFVQTVIMLIGALYLMVVGFIKVGGYNAVTYKYFTNVPNTTRKYLQGDTDNKTLQYWECGLPPENALHLFKSASDPHLPWTGIVFGITISAVWYWCSDQGLKRREPSMLWGLEITKLTKAFLKVGGWESAKTLYLSSAPSVFDNTTTCGLPAKNSLHLFRGANDSFMPWTGMVFGLTVSGVWYWCTDQVIVQRALASKDLSHAKGGCLMAGYLKFLPMWIIVVPGMISRILFPDTVGCADADICEEACGQRTGCTNIAYPTLVLELMPVGARGLMMAVMMAALMSSLTSIFNSSSTIFTMDIWVLIRKNCKDTELMIVGRVFVLAMVAIGIAWIPIVQNFSQLFHYIQSVTSFLAPPICAVYVLAVSWERINEQGAFWSLMIGLVIGVIRFGWESAYPQVPCGEDSDKPPIIADVHYLHFGILLFGIVFIAAIVISLLTKPIDKKHLVRLTFGTRNSTEERIPIWEAESEGGAETDDGQVNKAYIGSQSDMEHSQRVDPGYSESEEESPWYKTALSWVCGVEKHPELELTPEEEAAIAKKQTSLKEQPLWKKVCNINAVILLTCTVFYWGFFY